MCVEIVDVANKKFERFKNDNSLKHIQNTLYIDRKAIDIIDCCDDSDGGISVILETVKENLYNMAKLFTRQKMTKTASSV